ncbi:hypothetical protein KBTX_02278 [wastewater metagenome]|uniref:Uncharacterized protein n=2 Tax=unclassified sequences TaxID=12908 RepID=A0A5B8R9T1_9ZZZZ|nr:hypothetical protein KBTEX_02278 [uncultured organism]
MPPRKGPRWLSGDAIRPASARRWPPAPVFTGVGLPERARRGSFMMTGHAPRPGREIGAPLCCPRSMIVGPSSATAQSRGYHAYWYILYNSRLPAASLSRQVDGRLPRSGSDGPTSGALCGGSRDPGLRAGGASPSHPPASAILIFTTSVVPSASVPGGTGAPGPVAGAVSARAAVTAGQACPLRSSPGHWRSRPWTGVSVCGARVVTVMRKPLLLVRVLAAAPAFCKKG